MAVLLPLAALAISCSIYRPKPVIPTGDYEKQLIADVADPKLLDNYNALPGQERALRRNQVLAKLIWLVDLHYHDFEEQFYTGAASLSFGGDVASLGLTGVAAATGSAHLKSILSSIATGTVGIRNSAERNFYDQQARGALVGKMRGLRAIQLANIEARMKEPASVYTLEQGLADINRYYEAGTLIGALQAIAVSAGQDHDTAESLRRATAAAPQKY